MTKETGHFVICAVQLSNHLLMSIVGLNCQKYIGIFFLRVLNINSTIVPSRPESDIKLPILEDVHEPCFTICAVATLAPGVLEKNNKEN